MKRFFTIFSILLISSCTIYAGDYFGEDKKTGELNLYSRLKYETINSEEKLVKVDYVTEKNFQQSKIQSAFLGKEMLLVKKYRTDFFESNYVEADRDARLLNNSLDPKIKKGMRKKLFAHLTYNGEDYRLINAYRNFYYMLKNDGSVYGKMIRIKDDYAELLSDTFTLSSKIKFLPVIEKRRTSTQPINSMSVTYNGIAQNQIILNYMTYYLGSANSGNFQTIHVPNKPGNIMVGGAAIRILNANNQKIDFIVLQEPRI